MFEFEELKANIVENSCAPGKTNQEQAQHIFELEIVRRIMKYVFDSLEKFIDLSGTNTTFSDFLNWNQSTILFTGKEMILCNRLFKAYVDKTINDNNQSPENQDIPSELSLKQQIGTKRALLIGNNAYKKANQLENSIKNVNDLDKKLRSINFEVTIGTDLTNDEMDEIILTFVDQIKENDIVIFFFVGHEVEINNQYFLIPTNDQRITNNRLYNKRAVDTEGTLELIMEQKPLVGIFLFDCSFSYLQDNKIISKTNSLNLRLSPNSIVVYSRGTCKTTENNNTFTDQLLKYITEPNMAITKMLTTVCDETNQANKNQISCQMGYLRNTDIYLNFQAEEIPLSRPQHQNGALEQLIINQKGDLKLTLSLQEVNDENIDIIVPTLNSRR
ncbi:unnamed protein product [Adineta steineri]|uniref:Caspase family p20 domain-containing protein n=1 Tax=Adineta steineri TaxID=433720 RepID=A0A814A532_9BILA|nr:unnamed protein product [Adineta steineri]CAF0907452.1 unnamed protein product [Adineta steineri]